ncbi:MAG: protein kinase [Melioribacteraceae bacterium]|jgi:serine/threonine-protein kinase|nr:protein kinase [Melioribacteraceae bacterium]
MENLIGKVIENYRVVSVLGKGGMGIVYKAYDTKLDRYVAIKMLNSTSHDKERFIERFKREAKNQAKLSHPNIVTVYGFIEYEDLLGIVMEYVEGESLEKVIERQGRFNISDLLYIMKQLLLGIGYAHTKGFVHRDIKPSNIILNKEGVTKIMDFGISKSLFDNSLTKTGSKVGTVYYMSPEQVKGLEVTHRSDIYSIGCTAFEMVTGAPPFDYQSEYEVMDSHLKKTPPLISEKIQNVPDLLNKIVKRSLEKNPNDRFNSCEEMYLEMQELDKNVAKYQTGYFKKDEEKTKTYKAFSILAYVGIVLALIGLAYFAYLQVDSLLKSNSIDNFKKYSIQTLFDNDESRFKFSEIVKIPTDIKNNLNSIYFGSAVFATAVGDSGTIIISRDSGNTWQSQFSGVSVTLNDITLLRNGRGIAIGDSSSIIISDDQFSTVSILPVEKGYTFFSIKFINESTGFITGNKGLILKTEDSGNSWYRVNANTNQVIFDLSFFDPNRGFAVGWNGTLLSTTDAGETWTRVNLIQTDNYLKSIDVNNRGYGLIVGGDGTIFRSTNYGQSWEKVVVKSNIGAFQKVKFLSEGFALVLGNRGNLLLTKDKGETWNSIDSQIYSNMKGIALTRGNRVFLCGVNGMMFKIQ